MSPQCKSTGYPLSSNRRTLNFSMVTGPKYLLALSNPAEFGIINGTWRLSLSRCAGKRNSKLDACGEKYWSILVVFWVLRISVAVYFKVWYGQLLHQHRSSDHIPRMDWSSSVHPKVSKSWDLRCDVHSCHSIFLEILHYIFAVHYGFWSKLLFPVFR